LSKDQRVIGEDMVAHEARTVAVPLDERASVVARIVAIIRMSHMSIVSDSSGNGS
jgi:hypothetical protein